MEKEKTLKKPIAERSRFAPKNDKLEKIYESMLLGELTFSEEPPTKKTPLKFLDVWQGEHKSSIGYGGNKGGKAFVSGNIPHNAEFTFSRKQVPMIIKLLKMKDSPLVKE